jgi:hypothetical protein
MRIKESFGMENKGFCPIISLSDLVKKDCGYGSFIVLRLGTKPIRNLFVVSLRFDFAHRPEPVEGSNLNSNR